MVEEGVLKSPRRSTRAVTLQDRDGNPVAALDHDAALLLARFTRPRRGEQLAKTIADFDKLRTPILRMVMDGVLEAEVDGRFVSGVDFTAAIGNDSAGNLVDKMDDLSRRAIQTAVVHPSADDVDLARRLYRSGFGPRGITNPIHDLDRDGIADWLNVRRSCDQLASYDYAQDDFWHHWLSYVSKSAALHKLYICPPVDALPEVLRLAAQTCAALDLPGLKVGATSTNVLRSDCLVLYATDRASLLRTISEIRPGLNGLVGRGLTFAMQADLSLALYMAEDQRGSELEGMHGVVSWRGSVCARLARSIGDAKRQNRALTQFAAEHALRRLSFDGIDTARWTPTGWCET